MVTFLVLLAGSARSAPATNQALSFYAPFDDVATAEIAEGASSEPVAARNLSFVDGVSGKAVFIKRAKRQKERALLAYSGGHYFATPSGTISFWVQPNWDGYKTSTRDFPSYKFFSAFASSADADKRPVQKMRLWMWNWLRCDLVGQEEDKKHLMINWKSPIGWLRGTWLRGDWWHLALSWNETGENQLYVNGQPVIQNAPLDLEKITRFFVGGRIANADAAFDELKIFSRALTDAEVVGEFRTFAPVDLVVERRFLRADSPEQLQIDVSSGDGVRVPVVGTVQLRVTADSDGRLIAEMERTLALSKRMPLTMDLPKMAEGDYRVRCSLRTETCNWQRSFQLTVYRQLQAPEVSSDPVKLGRCLVDLDLTKKDHGYMESAPVNIESVEGVGMYLETG